MQPRVWARSDDGRFEWVTLSAKYLPQAIEVYMKSFCVNENLSKVVRLAQSKKGCEQLGEILTEAAQDGVSVIGVEIATDKVVGVGINKLNCKGSPEMPILQRYCEKEGLDPGFKEFNNFMNQLEEKVDIYKHYGVSAMMDHMFLATHPDYYRLGVGLKTVAATMEISKALYKGEDVAVPISEDKYPWKKIPPPRPEIIIALFSSPLSQKIGKKLGWEYVTDINYDDVFYEGKSYASRLEKGNDCCMYMAIKISKK